MAKSLFFPILSILIFFTVTASALGGKVGGRTPVKDVESNKEVQDLGRFSVQAYNSKLKGNGGKLLSFSRVVEAETQVVSGIKYYLKISASGGDKAANSYDAVVWVKPWLKTKELLDFAPSVPPTDTK